ncbi:MAG: hypothetical protein U0835_01450 [Isosphaeraceae bacterium]
MLTRDGGPPPERVRAAIEAQENPGLSVTAYVVAGPAGPGDPNRWAAIARARNHARRVGEAPWVMFVDDDVVLGPGCVARLVAALDSRPEHAALAADYLGESQCDRPSGRGLAMPSRHVALGATLFRRDVLAFLPFRWAPGRCECLCCAEDLRRAGFAIDYLPGAEASHEPELTKPAASCAPRQSTPKAEAPASSSSPPRVLAAFNRAHWKKFHRVFLHSLRLYGNPERVTAYAYGLSASERRMLEGTPGVDPVFRTDVGVNPAVGRLHDFREATEALPGGTPVAYWDAADVKFQARLAPLWELVHAHPERVLAARESFGILDNPKATEWVVTIRDPDARVEAFQRLATNPYLNSGFVAGTAGTLARYFREADRLVHSPALAGSTDWGDQTALNLYCHTDPSRWREVERGWNFALCRLRPGDIHLLHDGTVIAADGTPVHVAHGNAKMLPQVELSHLWE